jgi:hypothetical protein
MSGFYFISEITEMIGLVIAGNIGGLRSFFLPADQSRPAGAGDIGRKTTIVASGFSRCAALSLKHKFPSQKQNQGKNKVY